MGHTVNYPKTIFKFSKEFDQAWDKALASVKKTKYKKIQ